jgi:hypothetical protein
MRFDLLHTKFREHNPDVEVLKTPAEVLEGRFAWNNSR